MTQNPAGSEPKQGLPKTQVIGLFLGAAFLLVTLLVPAPETMGPKAWAALGMMLMMATWWSTEAIPIPATSLLSIVLIPALGLGSISHATSPYANPIIFMFLGRSSLSMSMQKRNLHRRIALMALQAM